MHQLEKSLGGVFSGLPKLPVNIRHFIVSIAPYAAILGAVLSVPAVLVVFGFARPTMMMGGAWGSYGGGTIAFVFALAAVILNAMAVPGLFKRQYAGWKYSFWSVLVGGLQSLVFGSIFGFIIGTGIGLYILFQVHEYYH